MRRALLSLLAFMMALTVATVANAQGYQGLFTESGYDFKGVPRYTTPKHSFIFTNNSQEDLHLLAARVSCQCTKVFIPEKRVYKPGEKGEVVAQLDGMRFTGVRHVTVTVTFQRGNNVFEVPLNIAGVIIENVSLEPQKLNFLVDQDVKPQEAEQSDKALQLNTNASTRTQQARVVYPGYNETVSRVVSSSPYVTVQTGRPVRTNAGTQTPLFVSIKNDAPAGYIDATVQIWSNGSAGGTPLTLNVTGVVRAPLTVSPGTLTFFTAENGEKITKNFVVSAPSDFTLKSVQSPTPAIECKFSQKAIRPAKVCVIPVSFDPSKVAGASENQKLRIETTDGRVLFLDVQISSGNFDPAVIAEREAAEKKAAEEKALASNSDVKDDTKAEAQSQDAPNAGVGFATSGAANRPTNETPAQAQRREMERRRAATPSTIPPTTRPQRSAYPAESYPVFPFGIFQPM